MVQNTKKNEASVSPLISIEGGGKTYNVKLIELAEFLNECQGIGMEQLRDIDFAFDDIADLVVNGANKDNSSIEDMKRLYNFVKKVRLLFNGMLYEKSN